MSRTMIKLTGLQTNGIGTNTQVLPPKNDIIALSIVKTAGTCLIADIGQITVFGGTEELHQYLTGADLNAIQQNDKAATYVGNEVLRIDFDRVGIKDVVGTYGSTLKINPAANKEGQGSGSDVAEGLPPGTQAFTSGLLEFIVLPTAVAPTFEVWAEVEKDADWTTGAGPTMRRKRFNDVLAAGEQGTSKISYGNGKFRWIRRVYFAVSAGTIDRVRVKQDGTEVFNRLRAGNTFIQNQYGFHTPVAAFPFIVDFTENGISEDLDTLGTGELEWLITTSAGGNITMYVEYGGRAK